MNNKSFIKLIITFCIGICITLFLYKFIPKNFLGFSWKQEKLAYFVVMFFILLSGVFNFFNKSNIKIFTIQLLAWCLIFLLIVVGYAFRFELNYATQRVISVLVPSYHFVDKDGEIAISRSNDGHFYIDAIVNGIKIKFMIDTGASDVALTVKDAQRLKFDLSKLKFSKTYNTANGVTSAAPVKLNSMVIGGIFKDVDAHIGSSGLDISLLGMSMLERFKSFKIDRDLLILGY